MGSIKTNAVNGVIKDESKAANEAPEFARIYRKKRVILKGEKEI